MSEQHYPRRVRHELRFRDLNVVSSARVAAGFQRVTFGGAELAGFTAAGFDDHVKMFFPQDGAPLTPPQVTEQGIVWPNGVRPLAREYTPLFDAARCELAIDFYIHDGGVASGWAVNARSGDRLIIGGPRGSLVVPEDYAWQLYVCDESGMPALRQRLEALQARGAAARVKALVAVADEAYRDYLAHLTAFDIEWLVRPAPGALLDRILALPLPQRDCFLWITGEGKEVKAIGDALEQRGGIDPQLLRAVAYWHRKEI